MWTLCRSTKAAEMKALLEHFGSVFPPPLYSGLKCNNFKGNQKKIILVYFAHILDNLQHFQQTQTAKKIASFSAFFSTPKTHCCGKVFSYRPIIGF